MLIQLVGSTLHSCNSCTLRSEYGGTGHLYKETRGMLKKLIQPVVLALVGCTLCSGNGSNLISGNGAILHSDNGGTGCLSKVTSSQINKLT